MPTYRYKNPSTIEEQALPVSRKEIDGYKVPSKYITDFLQVFYKNSKLLQSYDNFQKNVDKNREGFKNYFHLHFYYVTKFDKIIFWMIATLAIAQNH